MVSNGFDLIASYVGPVAFTALKAASIQAKVEEMYSRAASIFRKNLKKLAQIIHPIDGGTSEQLVRFAGPQTDYTYNDDRQLEIVTRPDSQTITFNYGSTTAKLDSIVTAAGTNDFTYYFGELYTTTSYDGVLRIHLVSANLLSSESITYVPSTRTSNVMYGYNSDHLKSSEQVDSNTTTGVNYSFTYDDDGLMVKSGDETFIRSSSTGRVTQTAIGSNMKQLYAYSSSFGELSQTQAKYGSTVKYQEDLVRDDLGRISDRTEKYGSTTNVYGYTYDSAGRLTDISLNSSPQSSYYYDTNGNRTSQTVNSVTTNGT